MVCFWLCLCGVTDVVGYEYAVGGGVGETIHVRTTIL